MRQTVYLSSPFHGYKTVTKRIGNASNMAFSKNCGGKAPVMTLDTKIITHALPVSNNT